MSLVDASFGGLRWREALTYPLAQIGGSMLDAIAANAMFARAGEHLDQAAVGACISAAYWFTSSTSFTDLAIIVGRTLSDTFAGIAPRRCQSSSSRNLAGGAVAIVVIRGLYPDVMPERAAQVVLPHDDGRVSTERPATRRHARRPIEKVG